MKKYSYIIFSPPYCENNGGAIVLHKLCHELNEVGCESYLWPSRNGKKITLRKKISLWIKGKLTFRVNPDFNTPIAKTRDVNEKSIVVYPEIVNGNPLGHNHIVRWLLNKPGLLTGKDANFGINELFFYFQPNFIDNKFNIDPNNRLFVTHMHKDYNLNGATNRSGSCYLMHKGKGRKLVHDEADSIKIDGLSHAEIAEIFKKRKYFYSYDEFTMYSVYAVLCGCISIVIPENFKDRNEWVKNNPNAKYGIAYGLDDIDHALKTQEKLYDFLIKLDQESESTVTNFVRKTQSHFNPKLTHSNE